MRKSAPTQSYSSVSGNDYGTLQLKGKVWRPFWWYEAKSGWPEGVSDVLAGEIDFNILQN